MEQKMNIKEMKFWKENQNTLTHLVEDYFDLPTIGTIKGCYIALTQEEKNLIDLAYSYITEFEREIIINMENSFIFNRIEQLKRNSIVKD